MIQKKLKTCAGCKEQKIIWKSHGKEKYCKDCWYQMERPKRPAPISSKMKVTLDEYGKKRVAFLALHRVCQANLVGCTGQATDVHHKAGRGINHNKMSTWIAVCRTCHQWIEENPQEAKELGLSESRLKTEEHDI
jgi:AMMECR1 domain-containing protein